MNVDDGTTARDRILAEFIKETGFDKTVASTYLESENWNLHQARVDLQRIKIDEDNRTQTAMPEKGSQSRQIPDLGRIGRGLSMANAEIVASARENIRKMKSSDVSEKLDEIPHSSFLLPDVSEFDAEFVDFLKRDLIDKHSWRALTDSGHLNWWAIIGACRKLFPLSTIGDGNCLLHAASLGMWGFHDRLLTLRKSLYNYITLSEARDVLRRRWQYDQWKSNMENGGLTFTASEWEEEWNEVVRLASDSPRHPKEKRVRRISRQMTIGAEAGGSEKLQRSNSADSDSFESLEEFHVFALAHVLRRPIVVISDTMLKNYDGEALAPIPFGGIYIPTECDPEECYKFPLVLAYDSGHFSACVPAQGDDETNGIAKLSSSVPLVGPNSKLLPIHFIVDPGETWISTEDDSKKKRVEEPNEERRLQLLQKYMSVVRVQVKADGSKTTAIEKTEKTRSLTLRIKEKASAGKSPLLGRALGKISSMLATNGPLPSTLYAANLDMRNKPKYYEDMISNYMNSSQKRFKIDRAQIVEKQSKCLAPGCPRFGSEENSYYCSSCYETERSRSRNASPYSTLIGPHQTASGDVAIGRGQESMGHIAQQCRSDGCKFYGSAERDGYCSSCYTVQRRHDVYY